MPQMSPLMWIFLMMFFTLFYLSLSVSIYFKFYWSVSLGSCGSNLKFNFLL